MVGIEAFLPVPLSSKSFLEVYLNRGAVRSAAYFGVSLQGGGEEGVPDAICVRRDSGLRVSAADRLAPDHWYRVRLAVPGAGQTGTVWLRDLTAGDEEFRSVTFGASAHDLALTGGDGWRPALPDLDTLVLRLGGGAQVASVQLVNE